MSTSSRHAGNDPHGCVGAGGAGGADGGADGGGDGATPEPELRWTAAQVLGSEVPKIEAVKWLQAHGTYAFLMQHRLCGNSARVAKNRSKKDLAKAYTVITTDRLYSLEEQRQADKTADTLAKLGQSLYTHYTTPIHVLATLHRATIRENWEYEEHLRVAWDKMPTYSGLSLFFAYQVVGMNTPSRWQFGPDDFVKKRGQCPPIFQQHYPLFFVPGSVILALSKTIPTHEELLLQGSLVRITGTWSRTHDTGVQDIGYGEMIGASCSVDSLILGDGNVLSDCHRRVFFSHRWLDSAPDNESGSKLSRMQQVVQADDLVWFDFMCIPQKTRDLQEAAIQSLPFYVAHCDIVHVLFTDDDNYAQYQERAFTNLELACASVQVVESSSSFRSMYTPDEDPTTDFTTRNLCKIFDKHGPIEGPFQSPAIAKMFDERDRPAIQQLLSLIRNYYTKSAAKIGSPWWLDT